MEYKVEARNKKVLTFMEDLMPKFISELGLTNSRRAVLVKLTTDTPDELEGATLSIDAADCYLVLLRPPARLTPATLLAMSLTLAHEMVHVRQLAKGILKFSSNGRRIWRGKKYTKSTHYLSTPWELDAFARQEILLRRAIES